MAANDIVQKQLDAYNAKSISDFCECFSDDVEVLYLSHPTQPAIKGMNAFQKIYQKLFAENSNLQCRILSRTISGDFVIDHEEVNRTPKKEFFEKLEAAAPNTFTRDLGPSDKVLVESFGRFKGLEKGIVIITDIEAVDLGAQKEIHRFYVALSRAISSIYVVCTLPTWEKILPHPKDRQKSA